MQYQDDWSLDQKRIYGEILAELDQLDGKFGEVTAKVREFLPGGGGPEPGNFPCLKCATQPIHCDDFLRPPSGRNCARSTCHHSIFSHVQPEG